MTSIPASQLVNVTPNVLAAGGAALDMIGLLLTTSTRIPIGTVQSFADPDSVSSYFGPTSDEKDKADIYFAGFDDSNVKPGSVLMAQYPLGSVSAYLRGGDISGLTLTQLQALSGTLSIVIDGSLNTASISLGAATSFSNAAVLIADGLGIRGVHVATFSGSISGTTLSVGTMTPGGTLAVGVVVSGTGVTPGTYITALATGTGGVGTYTVSDSQTAITAAMQAYAQGVIYDSISGGFIVSSGTVGNASTMAFGSGAMATSLLFTEATGAVLSQGTAAGTPGAFMDGVVAESTDWAVFTTLFDPDAGSGSTQKLAFSSWTTDQEDRFAYVGWDPDTGPTETVPDTGSFGYLVDQASYSGTAVVYAPDASIAVFVCGACASIDFAQPNGRTTLAGRKQAGLTATVTNRQDAVNLGGLPSSSGRGNGYSFYGSYATANDQFVIYQRGFVSGRFLWLDSYINQIWMNNAFQLALMVLLTQAKSIPFNNSGNAQIEAALSDPINAALSFGAIQTGVTLSASQRAAINAAAGADIAGTIETRGWYLQVVASSATVRQNRGPKAVNFWYTDGQSVQAIDLTSVAVL